MKNVRGFSLVEVLFSMALMAVVSAGAAATFSWMAKENFKQVAGNDLQNIAATLQATVSNAAIATANFSGLTYNPTAPFPQDVAIPLPGLSLQAGATFGSVKLNKVQWVGPVVLIAQTTGTSGEVLTTYSATLLVSSQPKSAVLGSSSTSSFRKFAVSITTGPDNKIRTVLSNTDPKATCTQIGGHWLAGACDFATFRVDNTVVGTAACNTPGSGVVNLSQKKLYVCGSNGQFSYPQPPSCEIVTNGVPSSTDSPSSGYCGSSYIHTDYKTTCYGNKDPSCVCPSPRTIPDLITPTNSSRYFGGSGYLPGYCNATQFNCSSIGGAPNATCSQSCGGGSCSNNNCCSSIYETCTSSCPSGQLGSQSGWRYRSGGGCNITSNGCYTPPPPPRPCVYPEYNNTGTYMNYWCPDEYAAALPFAGSCPCDQNQWTCCYNHMPAGQPAPAPAPAAAAPASGACSVSHQCPSNSLVYQYTMGGPTNCFGTYDSAGNCSVNFQTCCYGYKACCSEGTDTDPECCNYPGDSGSWVPGHISCSAGETAPPVHCPGWVAPAPSCVARSPDPVCTVTTYTTTWWGMQIPVQNNYNSVCLDGIFFTGRKGCANMPRPCPAGFTDTDFLGLCSSGGFMGCGQTTTCMPN